MTFVAATRVKSDTRHLVTQHALTIKVQGYTHHMFAFMKFQLGEFKISLNSPNSEEMQCVTNDFYGTNVSTIRVRDKCDPNCPFECSRIAYETTVSYYTYPIAYLRHFRERFNMTHWTDDDYMTWATDNLVEINVYYTDLAYMETIEDEKVKI